jgi:NhaP-type Na+/H+ or K+/H+ antiporter
MPVILFIANLFGISVFRLAIYASCIVAVIAAGVTIRQHYIDVGWYKHKAAVEKQDSRSIEASKQIEERAQKCAADSFWDVVTNGCKLEDAQ